MHLTWSSAAAHASRRSVVRVPHGPGHLYDRLADAVRPRTVQTVSEWADQHRVLSRKGSSEAGRWKTDRTPYLRDIMDSLSPRLPVERVVLMFAAQLGKTEVGLNWIGSVMDHSPGPMLVVLPTLDVRGRWVKQRLDPMLTETPVLSALIDVKRRRDTTNTEEMKDFPGGLLVLGGANSAASLASMPIRYVLCDEVDRFPWDVGGEGDPLSLIDERTKTFSRRKVLLVSTPTIKGASRIELEYEASDQREYQVPCPDCGEYQVLRWKHDDGSYGLVYQASTGRVWYACRHCGSAIDEHHKTMMLEAGRWVAKYPGRPVRGYRLSGLYSPLGLGFTWRELWGKWTKAHGDTTNLKTFVNTTLGEPWEEQGDDISNIDLEARKESFTLADQVGRLITAGVDVQQNRIECTVIAWDTTEEGWVLEHEILEGETASSGVWELLSEYLHEMSVQIACLDAGYNTSFVREFCATRRWCVPTKGVPGMNRPLIEDEVKRKARARLRRKRGHGLEPVGVDDGKALLYARLKMPKVGPGYIHFSDHPSLDHEWFMQLGAEKLVTKIKGGHPFREWQKTRARNEALDTTLLALVAKRLAGQAGAAVRPVQKAAEMEADDPVQAVRPKPKHEGIKAKDGWGL